MYQYLAVLNELKWLQEANNCVFAGTMEGDFLPLQLIYQDKTMESLPSAEFPPDWHITFKENHWSNGKAMMRKFFSKKKG